MVKRCFLFSGWRDRKSCYNFLFHLHVLNDSLVFEVEECDMLICWRGSELNDVHCGFISDILIGYGGS